MSETADILSSELTDMRTVVDTSLPDTVSIERVTGWTSDGHGGRTPGSTTSTDSVARIRPLSGEELVAAQRIAAEATWRATFPWNVDIAVTDKVVFNGSTYEVVHVYDPQSWNTAIQVLLKVVA